MVITHNLIFTLLCHIRVSHIQKALQCVINTELNGTFVQKEKCCVIFVTQHPGIMLLSDICRVRIAGQHDGQGHNSIQYLRVRTVLPNSKFSTLFSSTPPFASMTFAERTLSSSQVTSTLLPASVSRRCSRQ